MQVQGDAGVFVCVALWGEVGQSPGAGDKNLGSDFKTVSSACWGNHLLIGRSAEGFSLSIVVSYSRSIYFHYFYSMTHGQHGKYFSRTSRTYELDLFYSEDSSHRPSSSSIRPRLFLFLVAPLSLPCRSTLSPPF